MPIIDSNSVMNNICRYIESVDFDIKNNISTTSDADTHLLLMRNRNIVDKDLYDSVLQQYKTTMKELSTLNKLKAKKTIYNKYDETKSATVNNIYEKFKENMNKICSDTYQLVDYLIHIFYVEHKSSNKDILWNAYGEYIFNNIRDKNQNPVMFPIPTEGGSIKYLHDEFELMEVNI
jgi:hypothetical protein